MPRPKDPLKTLIGYCDDRDFRYNYKGKETYEYLSKKFKVTFIEDHKQKYLIEYQLEDEAPQSKVTKGSTKENAISNLKEDIRKELIGYGLEKWEAESHADTLTVLEIKKV